MKPILRQHKILSGTWQFLSQIGHKKLPLLNWFKKAQFWSNGCQILSISFFRQVSMKPLLRQHKILSGTWQFLFQIGHKNFGTYVFWWTQKPHVFWWTQKIMKGPLKDMRFWVHQKTWGFRRGKKRWDMSFLGPSKNMRFQEGKGPSKDMRFLGPSKDMRFR